MSIRTVCPNGHKLKIKSKYAGQLGRCPMCAAPVRVPVRDPEAVESSLSAPALSILTSRTPEADYFPPAKADEVERTCVTCSKNVPNDMTVCPHCGTSVATLED